MMWAMPMVPLTGQATRCAARLETQPADLRTAIAWTSSRMASPAES